MSEFGGSRRLCIVADANQANCDRIQRLCRQAGYPVPRIVSDIAELNKLLDGPAEHAWSDPWADIAGIVLNLSAPQSSETYRASHAHASWDVGDAKEAAEMLARVITVAIVARGNYTLPLLVISANDHIGPALERVGVPVTTQLAPDTDDVSWRQALAQLVMHDQAIDSARNGRLACRAEDQMRSSAIIRLHRDLWLDLDACALYRDDGSGEIPLTGREVALMTVLHAAPYRYLRKHELARQLACTGIMELDEHSIEQTVSGLRRKLGGAARNTSVLRTRYGIGYGLFPEHA